MNQVIQLKTMKFPKMISDLVHSNQFLKVFSVSALIVSVLSIVALIATVGRPPLVITLAASGQVLESVETAKAEDHIRAAVNHYLGLRYRWSPQNVRQNLDSAKAFVLGKNLKAYQTATANVAKFATERSVTQRIYPDKVEVDLKKTTVSVTGDRVTSVQGLKAAGDLKLQLNFQSGDRTRENPWGVYITKEREE